MAIKKANEYMGSQQMKYISSADIDEELHYGIPPNLLLSVDNLLSVILYCDWSDLSREFSSTFRRSKSYEKLGTIKKRNREYWHWSRTLRETVQYFGDDAQKCKGPFYCGMSFKIIMPSFNIRLCAPSSTSKQLEVATRFAGDEGLFYTLLTCSQNFKTLGF